MVPVCSPMAWCGNQVKRYSIVSFRGKAASHGMGCSCVVLPPSAIVFLFRLRGAESRDPHPSQSTIPHGPGRECCREALSWESTQVNVVSTVLLSESNMGPYRPKYI